MQWGEANVGDVVVAPDGKRWEVIDVVQHGHLRLVDPDEKTAHRFIYAVNWPEYRTWTIEASAVR